MNWAPIARIIIRYVSGAIATAGYLSPELAAQISTDQDVIMMVGLGLGALSEIWYTWAKTRKGAT